VLAAAFAVLTGVNDGGALLSTGLKVPGLPVRAAIAILVASVALWPLLLGAKVAGTLTHRLVAFTGPHAQPALAIGVLSTLALVLTLTWRGLPTSLMLPLVGGLTGSGLGFGLPIGYGYLALVLAVGLAAPFVGAIIAYALARLASRLPARPALAGGLARAHRLAFGLQCLAYAGNDGQKMLAVLAIAGAGSVGAQWIVPITLTFAVGVALGLPRVARGLGNGVLAVRPFHAVAAELAAASAVLGTAAIGIPVSMTQSVAGGLVGVGVSQGYRRVRWLEAARIGAAWLITLPASVLLAATIAYLARSLLR